MHRRPRLAAVLIHFFNVSAYKGNIALQIYRNYKLNVLFILIGYFFEYLVALPV